MEPKVLLERIEQLLKNPLASKRAKRFWDRERRRLQSTTSATDREARVREQVARRGGRMMHRRNGQYWIMIDRPKTLDEIETWLANGKWAN
jgi:hypothetical protein